MATFYYNLKKTQEVKQAIENAPTGSKVYFQPTHNGGCVQVIKSNGDKLSDITYRKDVFASRRNNYEKFCKALPVLVQDVLELNVDWILKILRARKFRVTVNLTKTEIVHKLVTQKEI